MPNLNQTWLLFFIFALCVDWGAIRLIRHVEPKKFRTPHWISGAYGDILLPFGFASSVSIASTQLGPHSWYSSIALSISLMVVGVALIVALNVHHDRARAHHSKKRRRHALIAPHEIWHDIVFVLLFFMVGESVVPFLQAPKPLGTLLLAFVGYGGWLITLVYDLIHPPTHKTGNHLKASAVHGRW